MYGYGTSIPPNNNQDEDNVVSPRKVIFCVHGKLSGCCTVVTGTSVDESPAGDYQQNSSSKSLLPALTFNGRINRSAHRKVQLTSFLSSVFIAVLEDHCHRERDEEIDKKARKKLLLASTLCVIFMIAEIVGNAPRRNVRGVRARE